MAEQFTKGSYNNADKPEAGYLSGLGKITEAPDPVFEENGAWFFWDETWGNKYGPYASKELAQSELQKYAESLG